MPRAAIYNRALSTSSSRLISLRTYVGGNDFRIFLSLPSRPFIVSNSCSAVFDIHFADQSEFFVSPASKYAGSDHFQKYLSLDFGSGIPAPTHTDSEESTLPLSQSGFSDSSPLLRATTSWYAVWRNPCPSVGSCQENFRFSNDIPMGFS